MAINSTNGLALFTFDWDKNDFDNQLFSSAIFGISSILKESLGKGIIREIEFEQGTLLLKNYEDHSVFFVLISNESRPILKKALELFSNEFIRKFPNNIIRESIEISQYQESENILKDTFPFVVNYN